MKRSLYLGKAREDSPSPSEYRDDCARCNGEGTVLLPVGRDRFSGMYDTDEFDCPECRGTGRA